MKLAISNIAWEKIDNEKVYILMKKYGFTGLEIAPTKIFNDLLNISKDEYNSFLESINKFGIKPVAMQSLLFGKQELKLFDSDESRKLLKIYLFNLIDIANKLGVKSLVFGSPKNRIYENISKQEAIEIAKDFFQEIGNYALKKGVYVCIEPNPEIYGGNFMCNTKETLEFVKYINNKGIKLHLDLGTVIINNENINIISESINYITHFHISEANLEVIQEKEIHHKLKNLLAGYDGYYSIEMKSTSIENIEKSLLLISNILK